MFSILLADAPPTFDWGGFGAILSVIVAGVAATFTGFQTANTARLKAKAEKNSAGIDKAAISIATQTRQIGSLETAQDELVVNLKTLLNESQQNAATANQLNSNLLLQSQSQTVTINELKYRVDQLSLTVSSSNELNKSLVQEITELKQEIVSLKVTIQRLIGEREKAENALAEEKKK
jgi:tRNA U34 5-methylaminomethyl-2-thiouridine-forming methyltransferase MnmC